MLEGEKLRYQAAAARGDVDAAVVFTGEGADVPPAGEMDTRLVSVAERALAVATGRVVQKSSAEQPVPVANLIRLAGGDESAESSAR
jgi:hypothetical protein